jgi:hypothetical protein
MIMTAMARAPTAAIHTMSGKSRCCTMMLMNVLHEHLACFLLAILQSQYTMLRMDSQRESKTADTNNCAGTMRSAA